MFLLRYFVSNLIGQFQTLFWRVIQEFLLLYWSHQGLEEETAHQQITEIPEAHSGTVSGSGGSYKSLTICKVIWQCGIYLTSFSLWVLKSPLNYKRPLPIFYSLTCRIFINLPQWAMHCSQHLECTVEQNQQSCQPSRCFYPSLEPSSAALSSEVLLANIYRLKHWTLILTSVLLLVGPMVSQVRFTEFN